MAAFTFVELRPMEGLERVLDPGATIGREGCDVVLHDPEVSRRHAAVRLVDDAPSVEDLGSSNGTRVNGERIEGVRILRVGDVVRFGNTEWHLRAAATDAPSTVPAEEVQPPPRRAPATEPGRRGDVPPPPAVTPSAVRQAPPARSLTPPPFAPVSAMRARGSAATRSGYTAFCIALWASALVALVAYFLAA